MPLFTTMKQEEGDNFNFETDIPANPISRSFSPIKFKFTHHEIIEEANFRVIDEEIDFKGMAARKASTADREVAKEVAKEAVKEGEKCKEIGGEFNLELNSRLQRKSEDDIFNTPKRERNQNESLNARFSRFNQPGPVTKDNENDNLMITQTSPQKSSSRNEMVKSLSVEFEQRLASIHVSPKISAYNNFVESNNNLGVVNTKSNHSTPTHGHNHNKQQPTQSQRSMSPIRCVPQLSPVNRLSLNDSDGGAEQEEGKGEIQNEKEPEKEKVNNNIINDQSGSDNNNNNNTELVTIEMPKLVSPSKIAAAAALSVDMERIKSEIESKWSKQVEFLQFEVSSLEEKYETSIKGNSEMRTMLAEYEKTLAQFIDARRTRPDQHSSIDQLLQDKKKLELEIQTLQISYQNLHQRYEDLRGMQEQSKINDATLRQSIQLLQQELATTVRTLENTRRAYEDKLDKINVESKNLKETLEYELSATKAKLHKNELKIASLESAIEAKTKENSELMTICDELIHKMDKRAS